MYTPDGHMSVNMMSANRPRSWYREIAERRGVSQRTIIGHLERLIRDGETPDIDHLMPSPDQVAKIRTALRECRDQRLVSVRQVLGDDYSYEELRLVRVPMKQRQRTAQQSAVSTYDRQLNQTERGILQ